MAGTEMATGCCPASSRMTAPSGETASTLSTISCTANQMFWNEEKYWVKHGGKLNHWQIHHSCALADSEDGGDVFHSGEICNERNSAVTWAKRRAENRRGDDNRSRMDHLGT